MPENSKHAGAGIQKLIVIGASAGGVESLIQLVHNLPGDLESPICIAIHTSPDRNGKLPEILSRRGNLPAQYAVDGQQLENGKIFIAPADQHLIVEGERLRLNRGPRENRTRPAINPLFRSAAKAFDGHTIGIILSGALDDGTAGMREIKAAGGTSIVQDPKEAIFSGMPESAIKAVPIDHVLKLSEIGPCLARLCKMEIPPERSKSTTSPRSQERKNGDCYICPDCGGPLTESENDIEGVFYQCIVGHRMTTKALWNGQTEGIERVLWSASRALRERATLAKRMAHWHRDHDKDGARAAEFEAEAHTARQDAMAIEQLIRNSRLTMTD